MNLEESGDERGTGILRAVSRPVNIGDEMKTATLGLILVFGLGIAGPTPTPKKSSSRALGQLRNQGSTERAKNSAHATESIKETAPTATPVVDKKTQGDFNLQHKEAAPTPTANATTEHQLSDGKIKMQKEAAPTVTPNDEKKFEGKGKMPGYGKEVAPTPTATTEHQTAIHDAERQTQQNTFGNKETAPTVTPTLPPAAATTVKGSRSNGSERSINLNSSRSNIRVRPTPTPRKK